MILGGAEYYYTTYIPLEIPNRSFENWFCNSLGTDSRY